MNNDWEKELASLTTIRVFSSPNNESVTVYGSSPYFTCIGRGTDAAVFRSISSPNYAVKLYADDKLDRAKAEAIVYDRLGDSPLFPICFSATERYLVLSYEEGPTLYECITQGIHIPPYIVEEVEAARDYIRSLGLNPRDIHLKNILYQHGKVKMLDVSEYLVPGNDFRWEHLKRGYEQFYPLIDGTSVPLWIVTTVQKWYNQQRGGHSFSYEEFTKTIMKLLVKK